jgi:hypothetical protein
VLNFFDYMRIHTSIVIANPTHPHPDRYGTDPCISALRARRRRAFYRLYCSDVEELGDLTPKQRQARVELQRFAAALRHVCGWLLWVGQWVGGWDKG